MIAHSPSSGTITAAWSPPPLELQHGIITGYNVTFQLADNNIILNSSDTSAQSITIPGLLSNATYSITVRTVNAVGTSVNATSLDFNLRTLFYIPIIIVV